MNIETVKDQFRELRLPVAAAEIEAVIADQKKAISLQWVAELLQRELDARREKSLQARIKLARF